MASWFDSSISAVLEVVESKALACPEATAISLILLGNRPVGEDVFFPSSGAWEFVSGVLRKEDDSMVLGIRFAGGSAFCSLAGAVKRFSGAREDDDFSDEVFSNSVMALGSRCAGVGAFCPVVGAAKRLSGSLTNESSTPDVSWNETEEIRA